MTDYKKLCVELTEALHRYQCWYIEDNGASLSHLEELLCRADAALAESEGHIGYPSYEQIQRFMFEVGFNIQDPDLEPAFPRAEYMKLAARIVDWSRTQ